MAEVRPIQLDTESATGTAIATTDSQSPANDAARDGLVGLYALRILDRGIDPRTLVAQHRSTRYGLHDRAHRIAAANESTPPIVAVGREAAPIQEFAPPATESAPNADTSTPTREGRPTRVRRLALPSLSNLTLGLSAPTGRSPRRLAAAGFAVAAMLGFGLLTAFAQEQVSQQRYVVQSGDSLESVAATFGVSPDAILAASGVQQPPLLTPAEVIVIPVPGQTPEEAALMAAERDGSSPFVIDAYYVADGDTLADVATWYQVPIEDLGAFNGITTPESLVVGQRLLIPAVGTETATTEDAAGVTTGAPSAVLAAFTGDTEQVIEVAQPVDLAPEAAPATVATEVLVPGVPAYHQAHNLSSGYAAGFIATRTFGAGVPEDVFIESVPASPNPHWGYRGNLNGDWGGTTDYGVYAEPLVPVLNANGFNAEVFYAYGDAEALRARLDAGSPVIAWLGLSGDTAYMVDDDGSYSLASGMHTVVVYGYDEYGVYLADPASGGFDYYAWEDFLAMWSILNGMGLAIAPW